MKKITLFSISIFIILVLIFGLNKTSNVENHEYNNINSEQMYTSLLDMFPKDKQGNSFEPSLKPSGPFEQPMTYGLILSAESVRYRKNPNVESEERVKNAVRWLIENSDEDEDGIPGWGLPQEWDAFSDGTINPKNHPYSITTSIVMEGLIDSLLIDNFWRPSEEKEIKELIREVTLFWLNNVYVGDDKSEYIGYSPEGTDMKNCPNVSGMFLSNLVKMINHGDIFDKCEEEFVVKRTHSIANMLINKANLEDGLPYWKYVEYGNNEYIQTSPNDLVHHVYVLWGIEEYRMYFQNAKIPFSLEDSIESVNKFIKDRKIYSYPQNKIYIGEQEYFNTRPSNLWGAGMMLSFYSKYNENTSKDVLQIISDEYGDWPNLTMWPYYFSENNNFYGRYAAHVLFGLSYYNFY